MSIYQTIHIIQTISFLLSQFTNALLLYLIIARAGKVFGAYRYLMITFSLFAIVYNYIDILTHPLAHIEGQMYVVINHGPLRYNYLGFALVCCFGASFGLCIALLTAQFFYRYLAVCRAELLYQLEGARIFLLFIPPILLFISWFVLCLFGLSITPEKRELLRIPILEEYAEDPDLITFAGAMYWTIDENGERHWSFPDCLATLVMGVTMNLCCITIVFCAMKTYKKMNDSGNTMSERTRELNKQLFITLTLQTFLPFVLMYGPVGLLFFLPLLESNIGVLARSAAASTAMYPAFEPLIAIFCIKAFRKALICERNKAKVYSGVASTFT